MKYYIATSLTNAKSHNIVRDALCALGHEITYDWTSHGSVQQISVARLNEIAHLEVQGVLDADFVLVLLPGGKGTHTELGLAVAAKKRILIYADSHVPFSVGPATCAFYHLHGVAHFSGSLDGLASWVHAILQRTAPALEC